MVKIISWNVNGIRSALTKGFHEFIDKEAPDIICLQEVKAESHQVDDLLKDYPYHHWCSSEKKGYAGVAVFSKQKPITVSTNGLNLVEEEGRILTVEYEGFTLVNVYTPNSKRDLSRLDFRYQEWDIAFRKHLKNLEKEKPVICCGDLNVAHTELDIARPDSNKTTAKNPGNPGFTDKERERFQNLLEVGFIDTYRYLHPETVKYTWWSYMMNARAKNIGWRIDYFLVSPELKKRIEKAEIYDQITGSDHCPTMLELKN